ncbi:MAG TPA: FG-GAP repeat protein, partial [Thermoanaerobaculia bacterium]|nr:FG-GAP repeat protein [Thermoanaerobaculia bacterium]
MRHPQPRSPFIRLGLAIAVSLLGAAAAVAQTTTVGLSTARSQRFGNDNLTGIFVPAATDLFAYTLAAGDFNGDGADDLATGMPYDNGEVGSTSRDSGSVVIRYSTPGGGLTDYQSQVYIRQTADVEPPEQDDRFGWSLASCDFNGDHFDDLAIGVPFENYAGEVNAGAVQLHLGSSSGLHRTADRFFTQSTDGIAGDVEAQDRFGYSLACGDFNSDDFADLAVGIPYETDWRAGP